MTTTTPDQWDERRAPPVYRVHAERSYDQRVKAILAFNSCKDDLDAQLEAAWLAMLEHAKLHPDAAQPVAQEAIAWSLRFDDDPRLNLSTVFDTEDEAKNYAARCGSATPVPLFAAPHPPVSAEAGKGVDDGSTPGVWRVEKRERDGEIVMCWVAAHDCNGFAYDAEILGDDEYRDGDEAKAEGMVRRLADCELIVRAVNSYRARPSESVAVSGEVSDAEIDAAWDGLPGVKIHNEATSRGLKTEVLLRRYFARAVLALAGSGGK